MINQYWDKPSDAIVVETQNKYKLKIAEEEVEGRTDIIIRTADEPFPIICELKREKKTGYSTPNVSDIQTQVAKYREFIADEIDKSDIPIKVNNNEDIKAFFICGDEAYRKLTTRNINTLKSSNIIVLTYQNIISHAERVYSDRVRE